MMMQGEEHGVETHAAPAGDAAHGVAEAAAHGAAHGGEHAGGGFPPFELELFASQLFWFVVTFLALYWVFSRTALPKVGAVLAKREATIKGDLDAAAQKSADADAARTSMEQAVAKARADARALVDAERTKVQAELQAEQDKREAKLAEKINAEEGRIAAARTKALGEVEGLARDLAATMVERILPRARVAAE